MSVINFFDFSLNLLIFSVLFKSCRKDSLFGVIVELLLLASGMRYTWYSIVNVAAEDFSRTSRYAVGWSEDLLAFTLICSSTLRVRLQSYSRQPWRSVLFMVQLLQSSCIPLSHYKSQSVGCKERLRVIVFDKIAILLCELKIAPVHCILMRSPSIFVWCDAWLGQVASNFFHALIVVHRVHCSDNTDCLSF